MNSEHVEVLREMRNWMASTYWDSRVAALDAAIAALSVPTHKAGDNMEAGAGHAQGRDWVLVPREPTAVQVRAGQLGVTTDCTKAIYAAMLAAAPRPPAEAQPRGNTPIAELIADYEADGCDHSDMAWVRKAALRYVDTMRDSQVRCLLYVLASAPAETQAPSAPEAQGGGEVAGWVHEDAFLNVELWGFDTPPQHWTPVYYAAPPSAPVGVGSFDAAVAAELPRISHIEYDSYEICKHFAAKVRERITAAPQQVSAPVGAAVDRVAAALLEEATDEPWTVAGVEHEGPDRDYYRKLARKVLALAQPSAPDSDKAMKWHAWRLTRLRDQLRDGLRPDELKAFEAALAALAQQPAAVDEDLRKELVKAAKCARKTERSIERAKEILAGQQESNDD